MLQAQVRSQIEESMAVKQRLLEDDALLQQVESLVMACLASLRRGGKIIFAGNGGSFADAQHLSAEFTSRFAFDRAPLASIALGTNNSAISAIGNDYGYEQVFARELLAVAKPEDVFIAISTSGNSVNVIVAVEQALQVGVKTIVLTGQTGGKLKGLCECVCVPSAETARIQECHILLGHILCGLVEEQFFSKQVK
ncbi:D-sedoheptulose-7-phosphate isomerase [Rhodoferax saidenbachensis]|uniref:Phosphoheptose isomerase n=1 Tax=Rhodoferax saidenbachensis TaxID=1484693 RepID=A0A1P8KDU0_9BURK|nr:D-sedoheptulose 7-phosphate isomerase [Rhodoferax saidenbachensis]APW44191.1 phosphoheptose isomerase [Rhodoferax saidenbachensis]